MIFNIVLLIITIIAIVFIVKLFNENADLRIDLEMIKTDRDLLRDTIKTLRKELELEKEINAKTTDKVVKTEKVAKPRGRKPKATK